MVTLNHFFYFSDYFIARYRAPEVLLGDKDYSLPIDVWSIGLIFIEFYILKPLLIGDSEIG